MLIAISQFNGNSKVFECLKKTGEKYYRYQCNQCDHNYGSDITTDRFFEIEKAYQFSFRLEIIT